MKRFKEITVIKKEIDRVICNGCGKELDSHTDYLCVEKAWGYGTDFDGERHSFDLCEDCYKRLIDSLCISPKNENDN